jgi:hypothetical protein
MIGVPVALMDGIIGILDGLSKVFPNLEVRYLGEGGCPCLCARGWPQHVNMVRGCMWMCFGVFVFGWEKRQGPGEGGERERGGSGCEGVHVCMWHCTESLDRV